MRFPSLCLVVGVPAGRADGNSDPDPNPNGDPDPQDITSADLIEEQVTTPPAGAGLDVHDPTLVWGGCVAEDTCSDGVICSTEPLQGPWPWFEGVP